MKILIIRNDNIGDLVCTTPLIEVLRAAYPEATIDLLGNSYNIEILRYDQRLSRLWSYNKAGHTKDLRKKIKAWIGKVSLLWRLRRERYDIVILATAVFNKRTTTLARSIHPKAIYGAAPQKADLKHLPSSYHCVEIDGSISHTLQVLTYARALGLKEPFPKRTLLSLSAEEKKQALQERSLVLKNNMCRMRVLSKLAAIDEVQEVELAQKARLHKVLEPSRTDATQQLARGVEFQENVIIGIQLSARRPRQRWSFEQWKELITSLLPYGHLRLFWSPGVTKFLPHPGDDLLAERLCASFPKGILFAQPTLDLRSLMVSVSSCDLFVGADGGAMHLAAALDVPTVTLFGDVNPQIWAPYSEQGITLKSPSEELSDLIPCVVVQKIKAFLQ